MDHDVTESGQNYTVVARRYRPRAFGELIGQDHVAQALGKAIASGRVGHAYLFTGARGVGKTSTARIFAKALNTQDGTSTELVDEISNAIDSGEDMDVIEIDGASNRGIEEIRQLRANVNVRPSRSRFKIYIIDEVHMLTNQAFNALLKTLEEPPGHVKFIFCTTDPDKIPITVLSRCQRFDFVPVKFDAIQKRLKEIAQAEGYTADDEAIGLLARRAAGSMRDSQSLLEQVMSFSSEHITLEQVHALLGTADEGRLQELAVALQKCDALTGLQLAANAIQAGADPGQLAEQLLNYLRDLMAVGIGGGPDLLKIANPAGHAELKQLVDNWGVQSVLSALQILDETLVRMRSSVSATTLLEVAIVQICQLENIASIATLLELVAQGPRPAGAASPEKKNIVDSARRSLLQPPPENPVGGAAQSLPGSSLATAASPSAEASAGQGSVAAAPSSSQAVDVTPASSQAPAPGQTTSPAPSQAAAPAPSPQPAATASATVPAPKPPAVSATPGPNPPAQSAPASVQPQPSPASPQPPAAEPAAPGPGAMRGSASALQTWLRATQAIDGMLADFASMAKVVETEGSDSWKILFPPGATRPVEYCEVQERRATLQKAIETAVGRRIVLKFGTQAGAVPRQAPAAPQSATRIQKMREIAANPYVKKVCEVLDGEILRVDPPRLPPP